MDSLLGINCRTISMSCDMCSCNCLACGTGSRASCIILSYFTGSSMRIKRSLAYDCHLKHPCIYPFLERFDSVSGAMVFWVFFFEVRQDTLSAINGPYG